MIDLRAILAKAIAAKQIWHSSMVLAVLHTVESFIPDAWVDWEQGDEEWGRIIMPDGKVAVLVCARLPLGFISAPAVDPAALPTELTWVQVASMSDAAFIVDQRALEDAFGRQLSDNIDYTALSAQDLWWATV
jgi:hypothetical protein